ncbi:hypothetical protein Cgig2_013829 [Carnegiea gigantea]|uniref:Uncharacterized protein n=1 Tax=Carnegiea gigantea TaxID=171969 RepID=A0A9Q1JX00_9CARY|nr:hypothetical protein Cgig2_013829 [Carnegiea gigantea]
MKGNDEYAYLYVAGSEGPCVGWVHGNEAYKGQWRGGGYSDRGRGGATINGGDVTCGVDGGVVADHIIRIKKKLRKTLANIGSIVDVKLFNTAIREYSVLLTNNCSLVVNLAERKCSCKWWQLKGLPRAYAMTVIHKQKLWVYNYVSDCYKVGSQSTIYKNSIHPMETHDSATVDNAASLVVSGEALDDGYNRRILPPLNPRPQGMP